MEGCAYAEVLPLVASPYLAHLRSLDLSKPPGAVNVLRSVGAQAACIVTVLNAVTSLNLEGNQIGHQGLQALADSSNLSNLRSLDSAIMISTACSRSPLRRI